MAQTPEAEQRKRKMRVLVHGYIRRTKQIDCNRIPEDIIGLIQCFAHDVNYYALHRQHFAHVSSITYDDHYGRSFMNEVHHAFAQKIELEQLSFCCQFANRVPSSLYDTKYDPDQDTSFFGTKSMYFLLLIDKQCLAETAYASMSALAVYCELECMEAGILIKETPRITCKVRDHWETSYALCCMRLTREWLSAFFAKHESLTFRVYIEKLFVRYNLPPAIKPPYFQAITMEASQEYVVELAARPALQLHGTVSHSFGLHQNWCLENCRNVVYLRLLRLPPGIRGVLVRYQGRCIYRQLPFGSEHFFTYYWKDRRCAVRGIPSADANTIRIRLRVMGLTDIHKKFVRKPQWNEFGIV